MTFEAELKLIGINPYVTVPSEILKEIFTRAGKDKGPIPICGKVNGKTYKQTLVKYAGHWRLYINTSMLKNSPKRIGEIITISVMFDPVERILKPHPEFTKSLNANIEAKRVFKGLPPSRQKEIVRYISSLKTAESVARNIERAIGFLNGLNNFVGRDKP